MSEEVLVLAEYTRQGLSSLTLELLGKGRELADSLNCELSVVILGCQIQEQISSLANKVDKIYFLDHPEMETFNADAIGNTLLGALRSIAPRVFLLGYTYLGMELGPFLAAKLDLPLMSNCVSVEANNNGGLSIERPLCGGTLRAKYECDLPMILSAPVTAFSVKHIRACGTEQIHLDYSKNGQSVGIKVREVIGNTGDQALITKADILVSVGRGMASPDRLPIFAELAQCLGGALACSRPAVDMGWLPSENLVGLSGSVVKPKIYIACGISGAAQHVAGMSGSPIIIAINKDPLAPIFNMAHYGIIGDMFEIIPQITREWLETSLGKKGHMHCNTAM